MSGPPASFPTHVGTLLNLGILYEDMQQFDQAQQCYQRILDVFPIIRGPGCSTRTPTPPRDMFYDEEARRRQDRLSQVLNIPVTDFELSVRSRNCLQKMGVLTLGDLTRTTEQELLASKNFGETSLVEIRDMLHSKGLELGQFADRDAARKSRRTIPQRSRPTSRPCSTGRSPISTSRCGPASAWSAWACRRSASWSATRATTCWSARTSASPASTKSARS